MKRGQRRTGRGWWIVAAALGVVVLLCAGFIAAGAANDSDGNPLLENPGTVILGLFSLVGGLGAALIAKLTPPLKVLTDNVQNDHKDEDGKPILLRDDQDRMHAEVLLDNQRKHDAQQAATAAVMAALTEMKKDIGGLRSENRADREDTNKRISALDGRVTHIERKGTT